MKCGGDFCFAALLVGFERPLDKEALTLLRRRAMVIAVRPDAVKDWRYLLQAMAYAHALKGPARDERISALMYLTRSDNINNAIKATSPVGLKEAVVAVYGARDEVLEELGRLPGGKPFYPEGDYDPWLITKYSLSRLT